MGSEEFSPGSFVDFFFMMWKENGLGSCNVFFLGTFIKCLRYARLINL